MKRPEYGSHFKAGLCIFWNGKVRNFSGVKIMFCVGDILFELKKRKNLDLWINWYTGVLIERQSVAQLQRDFRRFRKITLMSEIVMSPATKPVTKMSMKRKFVKVAVSSLKFFKIEGLATNTFSKTCVRVGRRQTVDSDPICCGHCYFYPHGQSV
jgi:hypothetical protein